MRPGRRVNINTGPSKLEEQATATRVAFLREALEAQPPEHLAARAYTLLVDMLPAEDLESLGDNLSRAGHMKGREASQ